MAVKKATSKKGAASGAQRVERRTGTSGAQRMQRTPPPNKGNVAVIHATPTAPDLWRQISNTSGVFPHIQKHLGRLGLKFEWTADDVERIADEIVAGRVGTTVAFIELAYPDGNVAPSFWSTPVGRHAAATLGASKHKLAAGTVPRTVTAKMLGVTEGTVARLRDRGFPSGTSTGPGRVREGQPLKAAVLARIGAQAGIER